MARRIECDAPDCPARAAVVLELAAGTLAFCGHHHKRYAAKIAGVTSTTWLEAPRSWAQTQA